MKKEKENNKKSSGKASHLSIQLLSQKAAFFPVLCFLRLVRLAHDLLQIRIP